MNLNKILLSASMPPGGKRGVLQLCTHEFAIYQPRIAFVSRAMQIVLASHESGDFIQAI